MMVARQTGDLAGRSLVTHQDIMAEEHMLLHHIPFVAVQTPRLVKNLKRNHCLADVVEEGGIVDAASFPFTEAERLRKHQREAGYQRAMLGGPVMVVLEQIEPDGHRRHGDEILDRAALLLGLFNGGIDRSISGGAKFGHGSGGIVPLRAA